MPFSFTPLLAGIRGKVFRRAVEALADSEEQLHPAQVRNALAAISLGDETDRIISYMHLTSPDLEMTRLAGGMGTHGATIVRTYSDAVILDGCVYFAGTMLHIRPTRRRIVRVSAWSQMGEAMLCSNPVIEKYFGHWLTDGMPLELLAQDLSVAAIATKGPPWLHEAGYRALTRLECLDVEACRVERLSIADDRGLNDYWIKRIQRLRTAIAAATPPLHDRRPVFIRRGGSHVGRSLVNEDSLMEDLEKRGFDIIAPESATAVEIAAALTRASLVVAVEGSAQAHAVMAVPPATPFVTIMPPRRFNSVFKPICDALGFAWGYTVADDRGEDRFEQSPDRLLRLIDRMI